MLSKKKSQTRSSSRLASLKEQIRSKHGKGRVRPNLSVTSKEELDGLIKLINRPKKFINNQKERIFKIPNAPIFYPSEEEFKDPAKYIASIRQEAEKYGICKIIPPLSFNPKFSLDVKDFKFHSRLQPLNEVGVLTQQKLNYFENLQQYHAQVGNPMEGPPVLYYKTLDLHLLSQEVHARGGNEKVVRNKLYAQVARSVGYDPKKNSSISHGLRNQYETLIEPFEKYIKAGGAKLSAARNKRHRPNRAAQIVKPRCDMCDQPAGNLHVVCEGCDCLFHLDCFSPSLEKNPTCGWYCPLCLKDRERDIGFSEGNTYTLPEFLRKADDFKTNHFFKRTGMGLKPLDKLSLEEREKAVEKEFWRLVDNPYEDVTVEYGADLQAIYFGSGFPTTERDPKNPISKNPWNLNVLPTLPESLFSHLDSDISGMTVPWLYVGMCFSTFCWHNEDHFAYSLNYQHWGDTKTWYGIPGSSAGHFESALQSEVPEIFKRHPDLLSHLALTISPEVLLKHKVPVYGMDQRPGEFVITFPKAYHAGFNHGLNFNEAVNFAPIDWAPHGVDCIDHYAKFMKNPIFCHDHLLLRAANRIRNNDQAAALVPVLRQIKEKEIGNRTAITKDISIIKETPLASPSSTELPTCVQCNAYCHLSAIRCSCEKSKLAACPKHAASLCSCPSDRRFLAVQVSLDEVDAAINRLNQISNPSAHWLEKYYVMVSDRQRPKLSIAEELLEQAGDLSGLEEVGLMRQCLNESYIWREQANLMLSPKVSSPRTLLMLPTELDALENIRGLVAKSNFLTFQFPEVDRLNNLFQTLTAFCQEVRDFLKATPIDRQRALELQAQASRIGLPLRETQYLEDALQSLGPKLDPGAMPVNDFHISRLLLSPNL